MTGKEIIEIIKNKELEDTRICIYSGQSDSGEFMIFLDVEDICISDEWNGNINYFKTK